MKLTGRGVAAFLRKPDPAVLAVLIYGPDQGMVRERAEALVKSVIPDPKKDAFRLAELSGAQLAEDPARLADEAGATSFFGGGGRRVVRVHTLGDRAAATFEAYLEAPVAEALIVAEGGDLPARSSLRKIFEGAGNAAALPCYADSAEALEELIEGVLGAAKHRPDPAALDYLKGNLGADRALSRRELEKLCLYMGPKPATITLEDATAVVGDSGASTIEDICYAATGGDPAAVEKALARALREGESVVTVLRAAQRHLQRLQLAADHVAGGANAREAVQRLKPPVFFARAQALQNQLGAWGPGKTQTALDLLTEAEIDCKSTGMPDEAICRAVLLRIAGAARGSRR